MAKKANVPSQKVGAKSAAGMKDSRPKSGDQDRVG